MTSNFPERLGGVARGEPAHNDTLTVALETLRSLAAEQKDVTLLAACSELEQKLAQRELNLVVVGQFKRGKTSLLNALIGQPILPVAVLPLTSVVTVLRYGAFAHAVVHFLQGATKKIELEELSEYITEIGNPENRKHVSRVEVFYPSEYLHDNVRLIDTPGIGSVYQHNTQVTYDFLPRIDAAIVVTSPDPPLTPAEVELITDLMDQVEKIFLIINKIDLLDEAQLSQVINFIRKHLPARAAKTHILFFSARLAMEAHKTGNLNLLSQSGLRELEKEIQQFLHEEKEAVFERAVRRRLLGLVSEMRIRLTLEVEAARTPVEELRSRLEELNRELDAALRQEEESEFLLNGYLRQLCAEVEKTAKAFAAEQTDNLKAHMLQRLEELASAPRRQMTEELDKTLRREIEKLFDDWLPGFEHEVHERLTLITNRFKETVNQLIHQARQIAGNLFGLELKGLDADVELVMVRSEGYYTDWLISWGLGNLPLLLPRPLYRRYLRNQLLRQVPVELERNATRRAYELRRRLEESASRFRQALKEKLDQTVEGLRAAIHSAMALRTSGEAEAAAAIERLQKAIHSLDELEQSLAAYAPESSKGTMSPTGANQ